MTLAGLILSAGPGGRGYTPQPQDAPVPGQHSPLEFWIPVILAWLVIWGCWWLWKRMRGEQRGDDGTRGPGWNWPQWGGPKDWPKLPKAPPGGGPTPDYVPDEWVFEEFGKPPRLIPVPPPKDEV